MILKLAIYSIDDKRQGQNENCSISIQSETELLLPTLIRSGKMRNEIMFNHYYHFCTGESYSYAELPFICRNNKFMWDVATSTVTIKEFRNTHCIPDDCPIYVETYDDIYGAGDLQDALFLWEKIRPALIDLGDWGEYILTAAAYLKMIKSAFTYFRTKNTPHEAEMPRPNSVFCAILSKRRWSLCELGEKLSLPNEQAKGFLTALGYKWSSHDQAYIISDENLQMTMDNLEKWTYFFD